MYGMEPIICSDMQRGNHAMYVVYLHVMKHLNIA